MQTASSANLTTADSASAVEYTATDLTPISRQARATRRAISPRLAIRTFSNTARLLVGRFEVHQHLLELHRVAVLDQDLGDLSALGGGDLVHQLHRLDDADRLARLDHVADLDERV